ncbi:autotransporter outer membrane beta-barrel domain-containing protein [Bradyrhizobium sp.]|uniref:autotransporter outer membrane beta-barrel domain-containing protein n=1 Tax=Bradyrhizobium sp. TaxID=376 RepID=UPI002D368762|nr:autotransporter domain-containing protein [Bradyrhizobium sp.]HZR71764.1 autotransporter domain-containing protein [Bradyrhizobium sp.]
MTGNVRGFAATRSVLLSVRFLVPVLLAPLAAFNPALAANNCTAPGGGPASPNGGNPSTNITITCTGTTSNANNNVGFGTTNDTGNTYNIQSQASVSGDFVGLQLGQGTVNVAAKGSITGTSTDGITGNGALTLTNSGSISGGFRGVDIGQNTLTLTNASGASISGAGGAVIGRTVNVLANDGTLSASTGAIAVEGTDTVTITANTGKISVTDASGNLSGKAILGGGSLTISSNTGTISADTAIFSNGDANINNGATGQINGATNAITADGVATVANAGTISTVDATTGAPIAGSKAILGNNGVVISSNTGNIIGDTAIFSGGDANINNGATGQINGATNAIRALGVATIANAGTISASGNRSAAIDGDTVVITGNSGNISGTGNGINAGTNVTILSNTGTISGNFAVGSDSGTGNITNNVGGRIIGGAFGININGGTIVNAGTISGNVGVESSGPIVITNSGTIKSTAGATGMAIQLSGDGDTLNVKKGSQIVGQVDFGDGHDVVNVDSTAPQAPKGVSTLSRATSAVVDALKQQFVNAENVVVNIIGSATGSGQPTVTVNGVTAALDPTALSQQDRALMDFTGGMSSMVQGRLSGSGNVQSASYALEDAHAEMFSKSPAATWSPKVNVWSSMFGAVRSQGGTDTTLDSSSSAFGGAIGVDRRIAPNWLVGVFLGGGNGTLNVSLASQKIDTDYVSGGVYSRFEWGQQFVDTTLQVGGMNNHSSRLVQNNVSGGLDHATASYNGWFVSPEIAYGYHINLGNAAMVTPIVRARYVAGMFDGFNEAGSVQTLSIGSRTLQDFEERGEVEFSKMANFFGAEQPFKLFFHGGVIAWQRAGDATVNAVLIGQSLSFVTPGKSNAVGGVAGVGFDHQIRPNIALFGSVEGTFMSDESRLVTAKGGLRVAF